MSSSTNYYYRNKMLGKYKDLQVNNKFISKSSVFTNQNYSVPSVCSLNIDKSKVFRIFAPTWFLQPHQQQKTNKMSNKNYYKANQNYNLMLNKVFFSSCSLSIISMSDNDKD
jgi:hypothetical protein